MVNNNVHYDNFVNMVQGNKFENSAQITNDYLDNYDLDPELLSWAVEVLRKQEPEMAAKKLAGIEEALYNNKNTKGYGKNINQLSLNNAPNQSIQVRVTNLAHEITLFLNKYKNPEKNYQDTQTTQNTQIVKPNPRLPQFEKITEKEEVKNKQIEQNRGVETKFSLEGTEDVSVKIRMGQVGPLIRNNDIFTHVSEKLANEEKTTIKEKDKGGSTVKDPLSTELDKRAEIINRKVKDKIDELDPLFAKLKLKPKVKEKIIEGLQKYYCYDECLVMDAEKWIRMGKTNTNIPKNYSLEDDRKKFIDKEKFFLTNDTCWENPYLMKRSKELGAKDFQIWKDREKKILSRDYNAINKSMDVKDKDLKILIAIQLSLNYFGAAYEVCGLLEFLEVTNPISMSPNEKKALDQLHHIGLSMEKELAINERIAQNMNDYANKTVTTTDFNYNRLAEAQEKKAKK